MGREWPNGHRQLKKYSTGMQNVISMMWFFRYYFGDSLLKEDELGISHLTAFTPVGIAGGVVSLFSMFIVTLALPVAPLSSVTFKVAV